MGPLFVVFLISLPRLFSIFLWMFLDFRLMELEFGGGKSCGIMAYRSRQAGRQAGQNKGKN